MASMLESTESFDSGSSPSPRLRLASWTVYGVMTLAMCVQCAVVLGEWWRQSPDIHYTYKSLDQMPLPHIYLCPTFWMDKRKVARLSTQGLTLPLLEHMRAGFVGFNNYKRTYRGDEAKLLDRDYANFVANQTDFDYRTFFHSIALDYLGKTCWFEEEKFECDSRFVSELTESGLCSYFNPENNVNQTTEGPIGGLRFQITKDASYEPQVVRHSAFDKGIHLNIGGHWQPKLPDPIYIPPEVRAYISIQTTRIRAIRDCTTRKSLAYFPRYSKNGCDFECKINATLAACNCTLFIYGIQGLSQSQFCSPATYSSCVWPIFRKAQTGRVKECVNANCPRQCDELEMKPSVSYTLYDKQRIDWYNQKYNRSWSPSKSIMLHVYQSRIGMQVFWEEYGYTTADLISNIGGQMGLWLGLSLSTGLEWALTAITRFIEKRTAKSSPRKKGGRTAGESNGENNVAAPLGPQNEDQQDTMSIASKPKLSMNSRATSGSYSVAAGPDRTVGVTRPPGQAANSNNSTARGSHPSNADSPIVSSIEVPPLSEADQSTTDTW